MGSKKKKNPDAPPPPHLNLVELLVRQFQILGPPAPSQIAAELIPYAESLLSAIRQHTRKSASGFQVTNAASAIALWEVWQDILPLFAQAHVKLLMAHATPSPGNASALAMKIGRGGVPAALVSAIEKVSAIGMRCTVRAGKKEEWHARDGLERGDMIEEGQVEDLVAACETLKDLASKAPKEERQDGARGRPRKYPQDVLDKVAAAWASGEYESQAGLARVLDWTPEQLRKALDAQRQRPKAARIPRR